MNVLLIFNDQHARDALGCYSGSFVIPANLSPTLDGLASGGCAFENAICPQPVCTPSRGSLMTGTYPHTHGSIKNSQKLPLSLPTIGELLGDRGFNTGYVGKWHLGDEVSPQRGFENYWRSIDDVYTDPERIAEIGYSSYHNFLIENGFKPAEGGPTATFSRSEACAMPEQFSKPAFIANEACTFLEQAGEQPFLLVCNFLEPHPPYAGATNGLYHADEITLPANFHTDPRPDWPLRSRIFQRFAAENTQSGEQPKRTEADWRDLIARYYGLVTLTDRCINRILGALGQSGRTEDTLVIFTADHGDMMGSHGMYQKGMMYDESLRVPLLMRCPEAPAGQRVDEAVNLVDILPTVLDLVGAPLPEQLQGRSLKPLLMGQRASDPDHVAVSEWNGLMQNMHAQVEMFAPVKDQFLRTARSRDWKLVVSPHDTWELYHLADDPLEMHNLIGDRGARPDAVRLLGEIRRHQNATGDPVALPDVP